MIAVGEQTGALPAMLNSVGEFFDEDVATALAAPCLIEPIILIIMGIVVVFILISLYLPSSPWADERRTGVIGMADASAIVLPTVPLPGAPDDRSQLKPGEALSRRLRRSEKLQDPARPVAHRPRRADVPLQLRAIEQQHDALVIASATPRAS